MFRGVNNLNLDAKGRMAMPTKYRESLLQTYGASLVITVNHSERCLWVLPMDEWLILEKKVMALPNMNSQNARIQRLLIGHATEVDIDKTGRVLVPPPLRQYAGLEKQVVLIGQVNKFEVWSESLWNEKREQWLAEDFSDAALSIDLETLSL